MTQSSATRYIASTINKQQFSLPTRHITPGHLLATALSVVLPVFCSSVGSLLQYFNLAA